MLSYFTQSASYSSTAGTLASAISAPSPLESGYEQQGRSPRSAASSIASHTFPTALSSTTLSPVIETMSSRQEANTSIPEQQIEAPEFRDSYWQPQSQPNVRLQRHHQQQAHEGQIYKQQTNISTPDLSRSGDCRVWELPAYIVTSPIGSTGTGGAVLATTTLGDHAVLSYQNRQTMGQESTVVHESPTDTFSSQFHPVG